LVAETDDGVVKRTFDMRDTVSDILAFFAAGTPCCWLGISHGLLSVRFLAGGYLRTFFLPATVFRGPLRVRALV
jgi:hypothetical protein